jgi:aspartate aminotransferase-like enzyme/GNAT superfamily N-acetyltransferase
MSDYIFKRASSAEEKQAVYRLNYRTFVEEIPQHAPNSGHVLVDQFDQENTYMIALKDHALIGMIAVRSNRPFSLDRKLDRLDSYLPAHGKLCEIRLLSVEPAHRNGTVFKGLMYEVLKYAEEQGYDLAIISGTVRQLKLYRNMGFVAFGPLVGQGEATFQPMYLTKQTFRARLREMPAAQDQDGAAGLPLNFLPGPVTIKPGVRDAFGATPISHRSKCFMARIQKIKQRLYELTGAKSAEIMLGSGTLANDAVAWQLKQLGEPGLVMTGGEFGDRLVDHARRAGLDFQVMQMDPDTGNQGAFFEGLLARNPQARWLWAVHCETSTGALIDLPVLRSVCNAAGVKLCVDAISTFGIMPVDLRDVYFASAVSGKAVGGYPGLAMVFYSHQLQPGRYGIPRYLDLFLYASNQGVPFTHSSNLVEALDTALANYPGAEDFDQLKSRADWLRNELTKLGCEIVSPRAGTSPAVVTIALPPGINSEKFGDELADSGCLLSYQSGYLVAKNRVQICLMSSFRRKNLQQLLGHMRTHMRVLH